MFRFLDSPVFEEMESYLKGIDGINFCDDDTASKAAKGLSWTLADIAVSGNQCNLQNKNCNNFSTMWRF